eukprot:m.199053 g.199053  ORF g.199053 m.199053 type:complete len:590 (+) comp32719_c0_seq1:401-2170(+)
MLKQTLLCCGIVLLAGSRLSIGQTVDPQDDSNFSVQTGMLNYLGSFYQQYTPPYGIIAGRASLYRMARTGISRISVSFGVGLSLELDGPDIADLAATEFTFKLHSRPCAESGGPVYQHPYLCGIVGCTEAQVATAAASNMPLELVFTSKVDTTQFNGGSIDVTWPLHIPDYYYGQDRNTLSIVMYSPTHEGVPMVCADLLDDRQMDGLVYYVNEDATSNVPSVSNVAMIRDERGFTQVDIRIANLRPGHTYPAFVHSLPCVPLSGTSTARGGERYMRDISCYGQIGTTGCEATEENQLWLSLDVNQQTAAAELTVQFDELLRSDAQSILLMDCLDGDGATDPTGTCVGGGPVLVCIDLVNEIPQIASSSSTADSVPVTPQNKITTTANPDTTTVPVTTVPLTTVPVTTQAGMGGGGGGGGDGGTGGQHRDDETTLTPSSSPTSSPNTPPPVPWAGHNPCPKVGMVQQSRRKGARTKSIQLDFVDAVVTDMGQCCLMPEPPASLLGFWLYGNRRVTSGVAASAVVVGVAGSVLLMSAAVLFAVRRRRNKIVFEKIENDSYAVPTKSQSVEIYTTPPHKRELDADYAIPLK